MLQRCGLLKTKNDAKFPGSERLGAKSDKLINAMTDSPLFYAKSKGYNTTGARKGDQ